MFEEFLKCKQDFGYFVTKYCKVNHPAKGIINFTLYDYLNRLVRYYEDYRYVVVKKFRDGAFSTTSVLYGLWKCLFYNGQKFLFVSKTIKEADNFSKIASFVLSNLPNQFFWLYKDNSSGTFKFDVTKSCIEFLPVYYGKGSLYTHIIIDEAAFIPDIEHIWISLFPMLGETGKAYVVSTVNNSSDWFANLYYKAVNKSNKFTAFEANYTENPEYTPEKVAELKKVLSEREFAQEVEANFCGSTVVKTETTVSSFEKKKQAIRSLLEDNLEEYELCQRIIGVFLGK